MEAKFTVLPCSGSRPLDLYVLLEPMYAGDSGDRLGWRSGTDIRVPRVLRNNEAT